MPTSLLTSITDTTDTSSSSAAARASRSMAPALSTATTRPPRCSTGWSTAWCSTAEHTATPPRAAGTPSTARLSASVPPPVNTTSLGSTPSSGHQLARLVDRLAGIARSTVRSRRVAEALGEERQHRLDRLGSHRRGRRVIEVGQLRHPERVGADLQRGGAKPPSSAGGSGVPPSGTSTGTGATPGGGNGDCDVGWLATVDQLRC